MLDGSCTWVDSKDAAALAGLEKLPYGEKEYAGAIYQRADGKFCYSVPVPGTRDNFVFATDPASGKLAATYHSHHGSHAEEFSPEDVATAEALKKTSYIRANESGNVSRYEPGVDRPKRTGTVRDSLSSAKRVPGTHVGQVSRRDQLEQAYDLHNPPPAKP